MDEEGKEESGRLRKSGSEGMTWVVKMVMKLVTRGEGNVILDGQLTGSDYLYNWLAVSCTQWR